MKRTFFTALTFAVSCFSFSAFSLTSYVIYPNPQSQLVIEGQAQWANEVDVVCEAAIDTTTRQRIQSVLENQGFTVHFTETPASSHSVVYLGVNCSGGAADQEATELKLDRSVFGKEGKFDRHLLSIRSRNGQAVCVILGENTDAAFYGIASLEQMLEQFEGGKAACVDIADYADLQYRGLVEGYYGYPYSVSVKKDLMKFMMRHKMNTYLYGAKSDPYHSGFWKQEYPTTVTAAQEQRGWLSQDMIKDITEESHRTKVNFIWAIHPGNAFLGSNTVVNDIMSKFSKMYDLGVRQFAVFVDDVGIPNSDDKYTLNAQRLTDLQKSIEEKWNRNSELAADTVKPLHFLPQIYCTSFASKEEQRKKFFTALSHAPSQIVIYTTGYGVWSVPNSSDLYQVKQYLGRDVSWWWNYPCNDNADSRIYPADMYSNFSDAPAIDGKARVPASLQHGLGIVSNPMQEGEVSKIPLFSVADYAWNTSKYNATTSWNASFSAITSPTYAAALKYLSAYYRHNDSGLSTLIAQYKEGMKKGSADPTKLQEELAKIVSNCETVEQMEQSNVESDRLMAADLKPWTAKLKYMSTTLQSLLALPTEKDSITQWSRFVALSSAPDSLSSKEEFQVYSLEGMGENPPVAHRAATPANAQMEAFVNYLVKNLFSQKFQKEVQDKPVLCTDAENNPVGTGTLSGGKVEYITTRSRIPQLKKNQYAGISLVRPIVPDSIAVADTVFARYKVLYSLNGKQWKTMVKGQRVQDVIKYVVVQNPSDEVRPFRLSSKVLSVYRTTYVSEIVGMTYPDRPVYRAMDNSYDGDYATFGSLNSNQVTKDAYIYELAEPTPIQDVRICLGTTNGDYMNGGLVQVSANKLTWTTLPIAGTSRTLFTMTDPRVVKYSNDVSYCDFDGGGRVAKYVRLFVCNANTSKWLRIHEVEINKRPYDAVFSPVTDADGNAVAQVNDGSANTHYTPTKAGQLTYQFLQSALLDRVLVYSGKETGSDVKVSFTTDGTHWVEAGTLQPYFTAFSMADYPNAVAMRIEWKASRPSLYEIVEQASTTQKPVVDKIQAVAAETYGITLRPLSDGRLCVTSPAPLRSISVYDFKGRLLSTQAATSSRATLPSCGGKQPAIISVTMADGRTATFKTVSKQ